MNRNDFMSQLESLLQNISPAEREEALQYYNDYFEDAGAENEQSVIEALGNPAKVAENIKKDLQREGSPKRAVASDRAVTLYGSEETEPQPADGVSGGAGAQSISGMGSGTQYVGTMPASVTRGGGYGGQSGSGSAEPGGGSSGESGRSGARGMSGGAKKLLIAAAILGSPVWLGLLAAAIGICAGALGLIIGIVAAWFALIAGVGAVAFSLFIVLIVLIVVGVLCLPVNALAGIALWGGGLLAGGIGVLFMMLTVAMARIVTPAAFRGIATLFKKRKKENRA